MDWREEDENYIAISDQNISLLEQVMTDVNPQSKVVKIDVKSLFLEHLANSPNNESRYTAYALIRLLLDLLPNIPKKVLYLDMDTMFNKDPFDFYNIDLYNYELAGVKDRYGRFFMSPRYLNSGVLLLNMALIRQTGLFSKARAYLNQKKVFLSDQTAINKFVRRKKILPRKYNEQKKVRNDTIIRHYSMQFRVFPKFYFVNIKQWDKEKLHTVYKDHTFDDILENYEKLIKGA